MIDTQAIRSKILYLALRGQLTNQNPLEGTGFSLIENNKRILSTYSDDIKKRVGKGCKPITSEDYLFEIPRNWCWERFGNLVINFDSLRKPVTKSERKRLLGQYDYYGATGAIDRVDDYLFDGDYLMIGEDGGNFFVSRDNSFIARGRFWANNHVHVVQPIICDIVYLKRCLDAYDLPQMGLVYGIGAPKLNQMNMNSIPIPVPPLPEQQRIVERVELAFSALDAIDALQAQYADNLTVLKSKLIDAAIQGKLTEQLPEDGTAEDLYQQIQAEKQALINAGKIKKEKPLPEIAIDEIPFEIPANWKWVRFGAVSNIIGTGMIRSSTDQFAKGEYYYFKMNNIGNFDGRCHFDDMVMVNATPEDFEKYKLEVGDFLFNTRNSKELVGKAAAVTQAPDRIILNNNILKVRFLGSTSPEFVAFFFISSAGRTMLSSLATSTTNVAAIYQRQLVTIPLPLPPLTEQKRIVGFVNTLLAILQ